MNPVSYEEQQDMIDRYERGWTMPLIAEHTGRAVSSVWTTLMKAGVTLHRKRRIGWTKSKPVGGYRNCANCTRWRPLSDYVQSRGRCIACRRKDTLARQRDPDRRADMIEYHRIRQEAKRREAGHRKIAEDRPPVETITAGPKLAVEPLRMEVLAFLTTHELRELALRSGLAERRIFDIVHANTERVSLNTADVLLTAMGSHIDLVYDDS